MTKDPASCEPALASLLCGEIILFPTETVYGLGVDSSNVKAIERLYDLKGRPREKPFQWLVPDVATARMGSTGWSETADKLAKAFWPGPLTLVIAVGEGTIGWRVPKQDWLLGLLKILNRPLVATSANFSGQSAATDYSSAHKTFRGKIGFALDGGSIKGGSASTVVSVEGENVRILRQGAIPEEEIRLVLG
jgi:L-threonylcarbamoyladenylate synthase